MTFPIILGPCECMGCGLSVVWRREWQDPATARRHRCSGIRPEPVEGRCGATMRYSKELCARRVGHGYEHRSQYALDNAYRARMGHERRDQLEWRTA